VTAPGWPLPERRPKDRSFCKAVRWRAHHRGCRIAQMGITPGHLPRHPSPLSHRNSWAPSGHFQLPRRVMPRSSWEMQGHAAALALAKARWQSRALAVAA